MGLVNTHPLPETWVWEDDPSQEAVCQEGGKADGQKGEGDKGGGEACLHKVLPGAARIGQGGGFWLPVFWYTGFCYHVFRNPDF